jgi:D-alanyl-D-alanine carboxypeptidase
MAVLFAMSALLTVRWDPVVAAPPAQPELQETLDALVEAGVPGVAAFVRDPGTAWAGASGTADLESGRAMEAELRFRVGSVTKPFVATVALQLVAEGRLGLDDPLELAAWPGARC